MSTLEMPLITFGCLIGGTALGISLRRFLPEHHRAPDSKEAVQIAMGLVVTMAAVVLGLLVESAKSSYDRQNTELTGMSAKVVLLDRTLARYGPETKEVRDQLRTSVTLILHDIWSEDRTGASQLEPGSVGEVDFYDKLQGLSPKDDAQRELKAEAFSIATSLAEMRWLMYEQAASTISLPFLIIMIFWLTVLYTSFGLFAPLNATVIASFFISALAVSTAIFLIVEMYTPYAGLIQLSNAPLRVALAHLGQ